MKSTVPKLLMEVLSRLSVVLRLIGVRGRLDALCIVTANILLLLASGCQLGVFTEVPSPVDLDAAQAQVPFKIRLPTYVSPSLDPKPAITVQPYAGEAKSVSISYETGNNLNRSLVLYQTDNSSAKIDIGSPSSTIQIGGAETMVEEREGEFGKEVYLQWNRDGVHYSIVAIDLTTEEAIRMANSLFEQ